MKRILISGVLFLIVFQLSAQNNSINIDKREVKIGHNSLTNRDILANEYFLPKTIYNYKPDSSNNTLSFQLRGTSNSGMMQTEEVNFIVYDITNNHINSVIQTRGNKSYGLDPENGKKLWKVKNKIFYTDPVQKVGFGYNNTMNEKRVNYIVGTNISTGEWLWYRYINKAYGWDDIIHLNDSVILVVAAGLHSVNLRTGEGWDYDTVTGKKNYTKTNALNAAGLVLGAFTGTFVISLGYDIVGDVRSNVLRDSMNYYFASNSKIARIGHDGQLIWREELPEEQTSKSSLFMKDSCLYMVNLGFAKMGNRQLNVGRPFLASFDPNSGKQNYMAQVGSKKDAIKEFMLREDTITFLFKDKLINYSLKDGKVISEKSYETKDNGELLYFLGNRAYIKADSTYKNMVSLDSTKQYVYTSKKKILLIDGKLDLVEQKDADQLYLYTGVKDYKFLSKGKETIVLDKDDQEIAKLYISGNAALFGKKIYYREENRLLEIDIDHVIKGTPRFQL